MLKTSGIPSVIMLRNSWHDKLQEFMKVKSLPFRFSILNKVEDDKNPRYIVLDDEKKKTKIIIGETALKYLVSNEVPDCNPGLYFKDYLPNENAYLLLTCNDKITPVRFLFDISTCVVDEVEYPYIELVLKNLILDEKYTVDSKKNACWKFIVYGNAIEKAANKESSDKTLDGHATSIQGYMNDVEKMYQDTFIHKTMVKYVCYKLASYLEKEGFKDDAAELRKRADVHDNSKILNKTEFQALTGIINDKSCLRDASASLSAYKQDAIELHWHNNRHHPEFHTKVTDMTRLDRYEFVCDCYARSLQYGTEIIDFMEKRQEQRFHFPDIMFEEIIHYCKIIKTL